MSPQDVPSFDDGEIFALIKAVSGKRIEQRRRRDGVSQAQLAAAIGRSERWIREMEAGIATAALEDHIRCAHWLGISTTHIFVPLLCVEHGVAVPFELLRLDDLWGVEAEFLTVTASAQEQAAQRQKVRSTRKRDTTGRKS